MRNHSTAREVPSWAKEAKKLEGQVRFHMTKSMSALVHKAIDLLGSDTATMPVANMSGYFVMRAGGSIPREWSALLLVSRVDGDYLVCADFRSPLESTPSIRLSTISTSAAR